MSRLHQGSGYGEEEDEQAGSVIVGRVDVPFEQFARTFTERQALESGGDAKDFCKFLGAHDASGQPVVSLAARQTWHVGRLREVVSRWRGPTKHAAWLLAQTAAYRGVQPAVQQTARQAIIELLNDDSLSPYSRYRLLHHLIKPRHGRGATVLRFIDQFSQAERQRIEALAPKFLAVPAFELNLIALCHLRIIDRSVSEMRQMVAQHCRQGCEPVRNALEAATKVPHTQMPSAPTSIEPDGIPEPTS